MTSKSPLAAAKKPVRPAVGGHTSSPIRLGICGGFGHAGAVLNELSAKDSIAVLPVGICPAHRGEQIGNVENHPWMKVNKVPRFASMAKLIESVRPELMVVSTRPDQIPSTAIAALQAGCHVISEKPLSLDVPTLQNIHDLATHRKRQIMGMFSMRSLPTFDAARRTVLAGSIGKPVMINVRKSYKWGKRPAWFNMPEKYGGTWPWIGIHCVDIVEFVTGLLPIAVTARHANLAHREMARCEDVAAAVFEMENGAMMTASIDLCRPEIASTHGDDWIRVVGTDGVLEANASSGSLQTLTASGAAMLNLAQEEPVPIYSAFVDSLRGARPLDPTPFNLTSIALAARTSARTGRRVACSERF